MARAILHPALHHLGRLVPVPLMGDPAGGYRGSHPGEIHHTYRVAGQFDTH
jgi:hypothetical protein